MSRSANRQEIATRDFLHNSSLLVLCLQQDEGPAFEYFRNLEQSKLPKLIEAARDHHVSVRLCRRLLSTKGGRAIAWVAKLLEEETSKIQRSLPILARIFRELNDAGLPAVVIKSLDHWPDVGADFDLFVDGPADKIQRLMQKKFCATLQEQSWSDRLACKWNFYIEGLDKLVEIHVGRLGQTGEQVRLARNLIQRKISRVFDGHEFLVPCPEDQLLLTVLSSFYRRSYIRLCDVVNTVTLISDGGIDFESMRKESKRAGIRRGIAAYLSIVAQYYAHYSEQQLPLPPRILRHASFGLEKIYANGGFLRVPLFPQSAGLYTRELAKAIRRRDLKKTARMSLLPGLAVAAGTKFRITGNDKGIW